MRFFTSPLPGRSLNLPRSSIRYHTEKQQLPLSDDDKAESDSTYSFEKESDLDAKSLQAGSPASLLRALVVSDQIKLLREVPVHIPSKRYCFLKRLFQDGKPRPSQWSVDVTGKDSSGSTLLHDAAREGAVEVMKYLISLGALGSAYDNDNATPFSLAVSNNHEAAAKILIEEGQAFESLLTTGTSSSLYWASKYNMKEVVKYLLSKDTVRVDNTDSSWPPLDVAVKAGHLEIVQLLLAHRYDGEDEAEFAAVNGSSTATTSTASQPKTGSSGLTKAFKLLMRKKAREELEKKDEGPVDEKNKFGREPIHQAAMTGELEEVKALIARGASPDALGADLWLSKDTPVTYRITCMELAILEKHQPVCDYLLTQGVKISEARGSYGGSLLHAAARVGNEKMGNLFMDKYGLDPFEEDEEGWTPFLFACSVGALGMVKKMWNCKKRGERQINDKSKTSCTALLVAIQDGGKVETVNYLLDSLYADEKIVTYDKVAPMSYAAGMKDAAILKSLLARKFPVNLRDIYDMTPLHKACNHEQSGAAKLLIEAGAEIDAVGSLDVTPIMIAAARSNATAFSALLDAGADPTRTCALGISALEAAKGCPAILELPKVKELMSTYKPLAAEDKKVIIHAGIKAHFTNLPAKHKQVPENYVYLSWLARLGYLFLKLGREDDAKVAYEGIASVFQFDLVSSLMMCDHCWKFRNWGAFWICRGCADSGVCNGCYKKRADGVIAKGCSKEHTFLETGGEEYMKLKKGKVNNGKGKLPAQTWDEWIKGIKEEFGVEEREKKVTDEVLTIYGK